MKNEAKTPEMNEQTNNHSYASVAERIADRAIAIMENEGRLPWNKPWTNGRPVNASDKDIAYNRVTLKSYAGINQMLLPPGEYATFKQWKEAGGKLKKGAKGYEVVWWSPKTYANQVVDPDGKPVTDDNGKPKTISRTVFLLKSYYVFHISDVEGVKPAILPKAPTNTKKTKGETVLNDYLTREKISVTYGGDRACYSPSLDSIRLPDKSQFKKLSEFLSTAFHECVHSTGHPSRLNRDLAQIAAFGDENYSKEELVAEIGAAGILETLRIKDDSTFRNSAAYLQSWLSALKNDKQMLLSAATKADKAIGFVLTGKKPSYAN